MPQMQGKNKWLAGNLVFWLFENDQRKFLEKPKKLCQPTTFLEKQLD